MREKSSAYHKSKDENLEIISLSKFLHYLPFELPGFKIGWEILIPCCLLYLISKCPKHFTDMSLEVQKQWNFSRPRDHSVMHVGSGGALITWNALNFELQMHFIIAILATSLAQMNPFSIFFLTERKWVALHKLCYQTSLHPHNPKHKEN